MMVEVKSLVRKAVFGLPVVLQINPKPHTGCSMQKRRVRMTRTIKKREILGSLLQNRFAIKNLDWIASLSAG